MLKYVCPSGARPLLQALPPLEDPHESMTYKILEYVLYSIWKWLCMCKIAVNFVVVLYLASSYVSEIY